MVPLARALVNAGHEVAFATASEFGAYVRRVGFETFVAGPSEAEAIAAFGSPTSSADPGVRRLRFVRRAEAILQDLVPLLSHWQPDLLMHAELELAGPVAATLARIPSVNHGLGIGLPPADAASLWQAYGLQPPPYSGMYRNMYVDIVPPGLATEHARGLPNRQLLQPIGLDDPGDQPDPPWLEGLGSGPTVYVTLGTVYNSAPSVFAAILAGLRDEPVELIVTLGRSGEPADFGPQPANVHLERYVPQSRLLPLCDVVVSHSGLGTVLAAIRNCLPMLFLPQGAPSQDRIADACVAAGCGIRLNSQDVTPQRVNSAVRALLDDPGYRANVARLRDEIEAMPTPDEVVARIEQLISRVENA
jgi:UDP:flavonoid glycosyltransferase YjiC (YdhE family)